MDSEPPIRVMALHALLYCERLFYLEEVEEIRVADASVYAGRTLHEELSREEPDGDWQVYTLSSENWGLTGKLDALRRRDGSIIPYEHKRGRSRRDGNLALAWPSDRIQLLAYAVLLEEQVGVPIYEGRIRYHADHATVRIPLDRSGREEVRRAVERARQLRAQTTRPPICINEGLCQKCSLAPVCLPEEQRFSTEPTRKIERLFPSNPETTSVHIIQPGARIGRSGNTLKVELPEWVDLPEGTPRTTTLAKKTIGSLMLHGYPQITTQALHLCADQGIAVYWLTPAGRPIAALSPSGSQIQRRIRQYQALVNCGTCLELAQKTVANKVEGQLRYILRATRGAKRDSDTLRKSLRSLRENLAAASTCTTLDSLRGYEGNASKAYFACLPELIRHEVNDELKPKGRSRRPPRDRFNAILSFGYGMLYHAVHRAVLAVGLEPALGYYHTPRSSAYPLVLDLMELFRLPVWDICVLGSLNRMQWTDEDFCISQPRVWLSSQGRKKAAALFENRLEETWKHPVLGYSLSYGRHLELETRLLEKEWSGEAGLFARSKLR